MDDDGLNMRNWGYYEPSFKEHLGLQLMSPIGGDHRDTKPFLSSRDPVMVNANGAAYHPRNCVVSEAPVPMNYMMRDSWIQRDRLMHVLPGNSNFGVHPEAHSSHHTMQIMQPMDSLSKDQGLTEDVKPDIRKGDGSGLAKKRTGPVTPKAPRAKKPKKDPAVSNDNGKSSTQRPKAVKKSVEVVINGIDMDISGIPTPVCSCTGSPQQCYKWGCGGWQSACCTTTISTYPLPMSTKRRGSRIAGRKMSQGAFKKVLEKLASEGYNFTNAIDLKSHWAKHGTNKFVTIR